MTRFTNRERLHGSYSASIPEQKLPGGRFFLDGKEITQVCYIDNEAGTVRTLDVLGDGKPHATRKADGTAWTSADFPGREVQCPADGALSEILYGEVEIWGPEF